MIKENDFILNMVDLRAWGFRSFRLLFFFFFGWWKWISENIKMNTAKKGGWEIIAKVMFSEKSRGDGF